MKMNQVLPCLLAILMLMQSPPSAAQSNNEGWSTEKKIVVGAAVFAGAYLIFRGIRAQEERRQQAIRDLESYQPRRMETVQSYREEQVYSSGPSPRDDDKEYQAYLNEKKNKKEQEDRAAMAAFLAQMEKNKILVDRLQKELQNQIRVFNASNHRYACAALCGSYFETTALKARMIKSSGRTLAEANANILNKCQNSNEVLFSKIGTRSQEYELQLLPAACFPVQIKNSQMRNEYSGITNVNVLVDINNIEILDTKPVTSEFRFQLIQDVNIKRNQSNGKTPAEIMGLFSSDDIANEDKLFTDKVRTKPGYIVQTNRKNGLLQRREVIADSISEPHYGVKETKIAPVTFYNGCEDETHTVKVVSYLRVRQMNLEAKPANEEYLNSIKKNAQKRELTRRLSCGDSERFEAKVK